ncbi:MAG TPA: Rieske 2Fe-2S domain-containing protein, partial [Myxococcaceae bacterium]|nr:Rieske 2Fe-2S domain-containing protein [Myxococcaceae bacterium]
MSSGTSSPDEADARVWHPTGVRADLPDGTRRRVLIGSRPLVVVRVALRWYALDDTCPHRGGELSQGDLGGFLLHCPLHAWPFDVRTGRCPEQPTASVGTYPVRVQDGELRVLASVTLR